MFSFSDAGKVTSLEAHDNPNMHPCVESPEHQQVSILETVDAELK